MIKSAEFGAELAALPEGGRAVVAGGGFQGGAEEGDEVHAKNPCPC